MFKKYKIIFLLITLIILGFIFYNQRIKIKDFFTHTLFKVCGFIKEEQIDLPKEIKFDDLQGDVVGANLGGEDNKNKIDDDIANENIEEPEEEIIEPEISEINLAVPFTIQSPDQKWLEPFKEGCEEASILMAWSFLEDKYITIRSALEDIGKMVDWQLENYDGHFDLPASTTAEMAESVYELKAEVIELSSIEDIKSIIQSGYPLILPTAGRELKNPNFKQPGPLYHMLVVKGFLANGFIITNDPGTRKGENYVYNQDVLWQAIADWDYGLMNPNQETKLGILLRKSP
ncbi:C39 family peptidase [bacterium]|nr:C39 family peptidase [bacterium]